MFAKGTIVEIFEDPMTMTRKEGNAKIVKHVMELGPGMDVYRVNFIGDDPGTIVERKIASPSCMECNQVKPGTKDAGEYKFLYELGVMTIKYPLCPDCAEMVRKDLTGETSFVVPLIPAHWVKGDLDRWQEIHDTAKRADETDLEEGVE